MSRSLATTRRSWQTIWSTLRPKKGLWHEGKTADFQMLDEKQLVWHNYWQRHAGPTLMLEMAETLVVHHSLCSVTQVDPFGRPPVSICVSRWWAVLKKRRYWVRRCWSAIARGTRGVLDYIRIRMTCPFHLGYVWRLTLRVGRGFVMVTDDAAFPRGSTALSFDLAFYRPCSAFRTRETCRSRLDCNRCAFYRAGKRLPWTTDDFPRENRHDLCAVFSTRVHLWLPSLYYIAVRQGQWCCAGHLHPEGTRGYTTTWLDKTTV